MALFALVTVEGGKKGLNIVTCCSREFKVHLMIIIIIFVYCNWVVTRWQWLFYM